MNTQELINKIGRLYTYGSKNFIERKEVIDLVKQLDEPQKPVVPQFVDEFITEQKKLGHTLSYSIDACMSDRVAEWYWDNSDLFARAWLDGYEVKEEKRYLVKIIGIEDYNSYLNYRKEEKAWTIESKIEVDAIRTNHTRKELEEAGFGEVFDSQLFHVEEVKDGRLD